MSNQPAPGKIQSGTLGGMVPILSFRSILTLFIGLVVGAGAGWGYMIMGPTTSAEFQAAWPPVTFTRVEEVKNYESIISGRLLPYGSSSTYMQEAQKQGEFYAAKIDTMPFLNYLSQKLTRQAPQYSHTPDELALMMVISHKPQVDGPSLTEVKVTSTNEQESFFLARVIPQVFQDFLIEEENKIQTEKYQAHVKLVEEVRKSLLETAKEMANNLPMTTTYDLNVNAEYVRLNSEISALNDQLITLNKRAGELAAKGANLNAPLPITEAQAPQPTPTAAPEAGAEAKQPPVNLDQPYDVGVMEAQIKALEEGMFYRARQNAGLVVSIPDVPNPIVSDDYLRQTYRDTINKYYRDTLNNITRVHALLAKDRADLAALQAQAVQQQYELDKAQVEKRVAYNYASAKVDMLTLQLNDLIRQLTQEANIMVDTTAVPQFYATMTPTIPVLVNPGKTAPVLGGVLGMAIGWVVMNRRWLVSGMSSSPSGGGGGGYVDDDDDFDMGDDN